MASPSSGKKQEATLIADLLRLLLRLAMIAVTLLLLFGKVFLLCQMKGTDMFPAVKDGDLMLAYRLQKDYRKNDVVIYEAEGVRRTGRVVAREGDRVLITGDGTLRVNGTVLRGEILYPTESRSGGEETYTVPRKSVFILGDYRTEARDSRDFGPVAVKQVKGKLITILRRRGI
jgi:signal peptidase I